MDFIIAPTIYLVAVFIALIISFVYAKKVFNNNQDKSLFLASCLVGNTGNLGIPLGIALFGEHSVPYTSILNMMNILFIYIFSIYFLAGDKFKLLETLKKILKMPSISVAIIALLFNYCGFTLNSSLDKALTMGAYTAIIMQLIIFGIFMSEVRIKTANWRLSINISIFKHIVLPLIGLLVILSFNINHFIGAIIFLELMVPLAVNNVNLASLYNYKATDVAFSVLISSFIFIIFTYVYILIINISFKL